MADSELRRMRVPWKPLPCLSLAVPPANQLVESQLQGASDVTLQEHNWSNEASFVTPPPVGADSSVKLLAIADLGQAEVGCACS